MSFSLKNWNAIRLVCLSLGIFILYDGIRSHEWFFLVIGAYFTGSGLQNRWPDDLGFTVFHGRIAG